jgi:hypothetical protein
MKAKSIKGKSPEDIQFALQRSMNDGFTPTLAIVFMPKEDEVLAICESFAKRGIAVFGASSFGQFIDQEFDTASIVVMLLDIPPEHFKIELRETGNNSTKEIARSIGDAGKAIFKKPAFIVASGGIRTDGEKIIEGILESVGAGTNVFGGLAASSLQVMDTFVFAQSKISHDGIVAVILDEERISLKGYATGGCDPVGIQHVITKSEGNIVYTIDDQPALDVILRYAGKGNDELKEQVHILNLASFFQIQLQRENASPLMRTPMHADFEKRFVVFAGSLPEGSKVKFSMLPGFEVVDNVVTEFQEYAKNLDNVDAMIMFSCQGREIAFGPYMSDEIDRLRKMWNAPMIGLFSFGEIGRGADGNYDFYNMTVSLALLKENEN